MDCQEITFIFICVFWIVCAFIPTGNSYDDNLFPDSLITIESTSATIPGRMAAFGPRLYDEGIQGKVIPMKFIDEAADYGCKVIDETIIRNKIMEKLNIKLYEGNFIALVERGGGCSFTEKIRNMQKSGASGVIVGNSNSEYRLITMYPNGDYSDIRIPSVFILQSDMYDINEEYAYEDISIVQSESDWPIADIFMITTLFPVVFIFGIYIIYKFRIDTLDEELHHESSASIGAATQEEVDALPIKTFSLKKKKENDPETCAVCIEDFVDGDRLRVLPCRHEYHVECIDLWLTTRKKFCPICKRNIDGDDDDADENTPLLGRNTNNNNGTYSSDESHISLDTASDHIIDIPLEEDNINGNENENVNENENEEHIVDGPTPQEEDLIQSDDESDDPGENEPLINLVTRS